MTASKANYAANALFGINQVRGLSPVQKDIMRVFMQKLLQYLQQVVEDVVVERAKVEAAAAV
jgi:hypothetical protein